MGERACSTEHETSRARQPGYERRRPEDTALYQVLDEHWATFKERAEQAGGLPKFVLTEVDEYLRCGRLEYGCLRLGCSSCGPAP